MLTKTAVHAIRALTALARLPPGTYEGAASIAQEVGAPPNYLGKLLKTLAQHGLVESQKGLGGGFRLARDAREISLLDIVEPLEHVSRWESCVLGRPECSHTNPCALHDSWKAVRNAYLHMLRRTTVAALLKKGELDALPEI